jgi:hypothetical protein
MIFGRSSSAERAHFRNCVERLCRGGVLEPIVHKDAAQPLDALTRGRDYTVLAPDIGLMTSKGHAHYLAELLGERDDLLREAVWLNAGRAAIRRPGAARGAPAGATVDVLEVGGRARGWR